MDDFYRKVFIMCILIFLPVYGDVSAEPKCFSRFDYDEKLLMKLLKINDMVEKFDAKLADFETKVGGFDSRVTDIQTNYETNEQNRQAALDTALDTLSRKQREGEKALNERHIRFNTTMTAALAGVDRKQPLVAFTATSSVNGPSSGILSFTSILLNVGNGYDSSTGEFTCPVSGVYYFSFHIVKKRASDVDTGGCYLGLNGSNTNIKAYIDPQDGTNGADNGSYGVSNSAYMKLSAGDKVRVQSCSGGSDPASKHDPQSSFSGYLVETDL